MSRYIDTNLASIALDRVEGFAFESFVNDFFPHVIGSRFVPLGGVKDGGADGFEGESIFEKENSAHHFFQVTVQEDHRSKIRRTVKRLREFGREVHSLTYVTSRDIKHIDKEEDELGDELGVNIRIRGRGYVVANINKSTATRGAYEQHLSHLTDYLKRVGSAPVITASPNIKSPAIYVFLRQELDRRTGNDSMINSVADSLALWALEGTDPDQGIFMSAQQVKDKICQEIPAADSILKGRIRKRLRKMSDKKNPGGRKVRWHRKDDEFCLPYETREMLESENAEDEKLRLDVEKSLIDRSLNSGVILSNEESEVVGGIALRVFQILFERQGIEFSHFISNEQSSDMPSTYDAVNDAIFERGISGEGSSRVKRAAVAVVKQCVYSPSETERDYLGRLARTYSLLFTLNTEPRLIEYFQEMSSGFCLYVGSDVLVRSLSEEYLEPEDRIARNTLSAAAESGATLVLTEPVLEEVINNLRGTDFEFKNHIQDVEHRISKDIAENVPKIMLRSYLYGRLERESKSRFPSSWQSFVENFCSYELIHFSQGEDELRTYLQYEFKMEYSSRDDLLLLADSDDVASLSHDLASSKDAVLAENDALIACSVYGRRKAKKEGAYVSEFGYRTWWLTNESRILRHSAKLKNKNKGAGYIMRPDFLLNFLTLSPSSDEARETLQNVFPGPLGVQLSKRMPAAAFHEMMGKVKAAENLTEGRRIAVMSRLADELKSDFDKRYDREFE
ncbi:hypothetical protein ACFWTE_13195 [Nocardiopsis sp. NPDC058631]|uniref:hypothetical protein n=1 Tax=Nocardiopsis sp. NPDC058631 TaxID=3346566 RepID=UPI00365DBE02